jgi:hypothetical protein
MNFASSFFLTMSRLSVAERCQVFRTCRLIPVVILAGILSGCCIIKPGQDPVVVRAEQSMRALYTTTDAFLEWEYRHRAQVAYLKPVADKLRRHVPGVLAVAHDALRSYKAGKSVETRANLTAALLPVGELLAESQAMAISIKGLTAAIP